MLALSRGQTTASEQAAAIFYLTRSKRVCDVTCLDYRQQTSSRQITKHDACCKIDNVGTYALERETAQLRAAGNHCILSEFVHSGKQEAWAFRQPVYPFPAKAHRIHKVMRCISGNATTEVLRKTFEARVGSLGG